MHEVYEFLKQSGTYYLATVEGDQPRARPFGTIALFEGKLYIQTGKVKKVSAQIAANPKVEISACLGDKWLRVEAKAVEDDRMESREFMLEQYPMLRSMYAAADGNMQVLYLKESTATFYSFSGSNVVVCF